MKKKSLVLVIFFFTVILLVIIFSFRRYVVEHDYLVEMRVGCDPMTDHCFIGVCDPEMGERCSDDPDLTSEYYYAVIRRNAKHLPACGLNAEGCPTTACQVGEEECEIRYCTDEDTETGAECSDPESFAVESDEFLETVVEEVGDLEYTTGEISAGVEDKMAREAVGQSNTDQ